MIIWLINVCSYLQPIFSRDKRTLLQGKQTSRARFGLALSAIGDIDTDGYKGRRIIQTIL